MSVRRFSTGRLAGLFLFSLITICLVSGVRGYLDARADQPQLRAQLAALSDTEAPVLTAAQRRWLLAVEDPGFDTHTGVDLVRPGAGFTTLTQSLSKWLAFDNFQPGFSKFRQTGYAIGLESMLSKDEILALFVARVPVGRIDGEWTNGLAAASRQLYGQPVAALDRKRFLKLVAVLIAPARFDLASGDAELAERVLRITRLLDAECRPSGVRDVWLHGCARYDDYVPAQESVWPTG